MFQNVRVNIQITAILVFCKAVVQITPINPEELEHQIEICELFNEFVVNDSSVRMTTNVMDEDELLVCNIHRLSNITCSIISNMSQEAQDEINNNTGEVLYELKIRLYSLMKFHTCHNSDNDLDYDSLEMADLRQKNKIKQELLVNLQTFTDKIIHMRNHTEIENLIPEQWTKLEVNAKQFLKHIKELEEEENIWILVEIYIQPTIQCMIFVTGILGNILLIIILVKNKNMLTSSNIILLNLAIGDIFSLIVNLPLFYAYSTDTTLKLSETTFLVFRFARHLGISVSVFSVTALSVQRYCDAIQSSRGKHLQNTIPKILIVLVWFMACMFAIPHILYAALYTSCYSSAPGNERYVSVIVIYELVFLCIIPALVTTALTFLTANRLSSTVSNTAQGGRRAIQKVTKILMIRGSRTKALHDQALVNCQYSMATFSTGERKRRPRGDRKSQEMSMHLRQALQAAIITKVYPRTQIDIFVEVLQADGGNYCACVNAATLALVDAGIPMTEYMVACTASLANGDVPLVDVSHLEENSGGPNLTIAAFPLSKQVALMEMSQRIHLDHLPKVIACAMQGCTDIHQILDSAVRSHVQVSGAPTGWGSKSQVDI